MLNKLHSTIMSGCGAIDQDNPLYRVCSTISGSSPVVSAVCPSTDKFVRAYHAASVIRAAQSSDLYAGVQVLDPVNTYNSHIIALAVLKPDPNKMSVNMSGMRAPRVEIEVHELTRTSCAYSVSGGQLEYKLFDSSDRTPTYTAMGVSFSMPTDAGTGTFIIQRPVAPILPTVAQVRRFQGVLTEDQRSGIDFNSIPELCAAYCLEILNAE